MIFLKKENKNATFLSWKSFFVRMKNKGGIPAGVKNIVEDGEPLPAGIQYSVLSKDLTKESVAVLLGTIGEKEAMRQMPERISFAGDYVVIDKTYLTEFADKADAKKKAEEETLEIPEGVETEK